MNLFLSEIDGNKVVGVANSLDLTAFLCRAQLRCAVLCPWINFLIVDMKSIFFVFFARNYCHSFQNSLYLHKSQIRWRKIY